MLLSARSGEAGKLLCQLRRVVSAWAEAAAAPAALNARQAQLVSQPLRVCVGTAARHAETTPS
jgi:hypothetical protein